MRPDPTPAPDGRRQPLGYHRRVIIVPGRASPRAGVAQSRGTAGPGSTAGSRNAAVARLRGACAGTVSGALAIAAHGWAAGGMPLQSSTLLLLVGACTLIGALVTGVRPLRATATGLAAALIGGQLLGHAVMALDMAGMAHDASMWTPAMLAAHIAAALAAAIVIQGAEGAYRMVFAVLSRVLPMLVHPPAIPAPQPLRIAHRDSVIQRIIAADTGHTRGPPALAY